MSDSGDLLSPLLPRRQSIRPGMMLLRGFCDPAALMPVIETIMAASPLRQMVTPGGHTMSVEMTNCGALGWVSDRAGYRYAATDPLSGVPWPALPHEFSALARAAAEAAGFAAFRPDACLVNRYAIGTRLTAHQDRNEHDFSAPIVSVSLGLPAVFFVHDGESRAGRATSIQLASGDVLVWGGPARLAYHGVRDLRAGTDPIAGKYRFNLTMRRAG